MSKNLGLRIYSFIHSFTPHVHTEHLFNPRTELRPVGSMENKTDRSLPSSHCGKQIINKIIRIILTFNECFSSATFSPKSYIIHFNILSS